MDGAYNPVASTSRDIPRRAPAFACRDLKTFTAVEFPGKVGSSSSSVEAALDSLGGLSRLNEALATEDENRSVIEMRLGPKLEPGAVSFEHPIPADNVATGNIVLKVTRRKRKRTAAAADAQSDQNGIYTVEPAGVIKRTLRFRSMADFQYHPPSQVESDSAKDLAEAIKRIDVDTLYNWKVPPQSEDFSKLKIVPPPLFARLGTAVQYNYKPMAGTMPVTVTNSRGEEVTRTVNLHRNKNLVLSTASFYDNKPVPSGPAPGTRKPTSQEEHELMAKMLKLMEERPMWTRMAFFNSLTPEDARRLSSAPSKGLFGSASYQFEDGPFRDLVIRFGFDPRTEPEARKYQRVLLRNTANKRSQYLNKDYENEETRNRTHIFDGQQVYRVVGNYQLCDITDPFMRDILDRPLYWLSEPDERTGWYLPSFLDNFRELLRCKFLCLVNREPVPVEQLEEGVRRLANPAQVKAEKQRLAGSRTKETTSDATASEQGQISSETAQAVREANSELIRASEPPQAATLPMEDDADDRGYSSAEGDETVDAAVVEQEEAEMAPVPKKRKVLPTASKKPRPKKRTAVARTGDGKDG